MTRFADVFATPLPIIGVVHLPPLPGSPASGSSDIAPLRDRVLADATALSTGGVDGLIVENLGDAPYYPQRVPPETVAWMTMLAEAVHATCALPLGVNVLRNDGYSALAIATAVGGLFVRVNVFTGARLTDQGIIEGEAHELLRYRRALRSRVAIFADVQVKHSVPIGDRPLADEIEDTVLRGKADAIIVTGPATGKPVDTAVLRKAKEAGGVVPVLVGSGATPENVRGLLPWADGVIVGTAFKEDGVVSNPVSEARVRAFVESVGQEREHRARG